jgi:DNA repair protein RadC
MKQLKLIDIDREEKSFWETLRSGKFERMVKESSRGEELRSSKEAYNVLKPLFAKESDVEQMYFIFVDVKNRIISIDKLFSGSISSALIYPREIVKSVLKRRAAGVIMAHNHPSSDPQPSREDYAITRAVGIALRAVDVSLLDHIVVGRTFFSFADEGVIHKNKVELKAFIDG